MRKLKLLPIALMLVLCVGVLAIGIYAIQPSQNTISGTITVNGTNAPVVIKVYDGTDTTSSGTILAEKEVRAGDVVPIENDLVFNTEGTESNPVNQVEDVAPIVLTLVLSTTSEDKLVVNTPTIQSLGTQDDKEIVSLTKFHEKNNGETGEDLDYYRDETTGLACFTKDVNYTITLTFRLSKFLDAQTDFTYTIPLDIWEVSEYVADEDYEGGIDGVDYLYFGEYPQSKSSLTTSSEGVEDTGEDFLGYKESDGLSLARNIYKDSAGNRYVEIASTETGIATGGAGLYQIMPLKWKILSNTDGEILIRSDAIIEQVAFSTATSSSEIDGKIIYQNNYAHSALRSYLNNVFYIGAFNEISKQLIKKTTVDNGISTVRSGADTYICENTEDYIFSLSYADLINTNYGYETGGIVGISGTRAMYASEYAIGTGTWVFTLSQLEDEIPKYNNETYGVEDAKTYFMNIWDAEEGDAILFEKYITQNGNIGDYWSRSPSSLQENNADAVGGGHYFEGGDVARTTSGCVPALNLNLK